MTKGRRIIARVAQPILATPQIVCDGCFQTLPDRHFTTRSYQLQPVLGGLWCAECVHREQLGLSPRAPTFQNPGHAVSWAIRNYTGSDEHWLILFMLAGFADNGIDDPTIRELSALTKLPIPQVLRAVAKLAAEGWLRVDWATGNAQMTNTYSIPTERTA